MQIQILYCIDSQPPRKLNAYLLPCGWQGHRFATRVSVQSGFETIMLWLFLSGSSGIILYGRDVWTGLGVLAAGKMPIMSELLSSLKYKMHFSRQLNCWSLRCIWSIACRRCSNYIFILDLTPAFNGLGKDNDKMRQETFKFRDLVHLILETLWYFMSWRQVSNWGPQNHIETPLTVLIL